MKKQTEVKISRSIAVPRDIYFGVLYYVLCNEEYNMNGQSSTKVCGQASLKWLSIVVIVKYLKNHLYSTPIRYVL